MKRKVWVIYWICISCITLLIQLFHIFNFITQPTLNDYYTGKTVVYAAFVFGFIILIFIIANIYTFIVSLQNRKFASWLYHFSLSVIFLFVLGLFFNAVAERFFPLHVWEQSTLKKLQEGANMGKTQSNP